MTDDAGRGGRRPARSIREECDEAAKKILHDAFRQLGAIKDGEPDYDRIRDPIDAFHRRTEIRKHVVRTAIYAAVSTAVGAVLLNLKAIVQWLATLGGAGPGGP